LSQICLVFHRTRTNDIQKEQIITFLDTTVKNLEIDPDKEIDNYMQPALSAVIPRHVIYLLVKSMAIRRQETICHSIVDPYISGFTSEVSVPHEVECRFGSSGGNFQYFVGFNNEK